MGRDYESEHHIDLVLWTELSSPKFMIIFVLLIHKVVVFKDGAFGRQLSLDAVMRVGLS